MPDHSHAYIFLRWLLVSLVGRQSSFTLPSSPPPGVSANWVFGNSIVVKNSGKKAATNVRVVHKFLPEFKISPYVYHTVTRQDDGGEIVFPTLVPDEEVTISYLFYSSTPWDQIYLHTKSDEGFAQTHHVIPTLKPPRWAVWFMKIFTFIGICATVYLLVSLVGPYITR